MDRGSESPRLGTWVHRSLLTGLVLSGALLAGGLGLALFSNRPRPEGPPPPLGALLAGAARGDGSAILGLGLLVLMITPILRAAVLAVGWGLERRWRLLAVALTVLLLLGIGVGFGIG